MVVVYNSMVEWSCASWNSSNDNADGDTKSDNGILQTHAEPPEFAIPLWVLWLQLVVHAHQSIHPITAPQLMRISRSSNKNTASYTPK